MVVPATRHVIDYARHLGLRRTVLRSAYVAINQVLRVSIFEACTLRPDDVNRDLLRQDTLECRFLAAAEMLRFVSELEGSEKQTLSRAAECGDLCYGVLDGNRLTNMGLFSNQPTPLLGDLEIHFDPAHWYMYGGWTHPAYRGRRLHARSVLGGALELFDRGAPALVTVAEMTNYPSIVSALRMGWRRSGKLYCVGAGRWVVYSYLADNSDGSKTG